MKEATTTATILFWLSMCTLDVQKNKSGERVQNILNYIDACCVSKDPSWLIEPHSKQALRQGQWQQIGQATIHRLHVTNFNNVWRVTRREHLREGEGYVWQSSVNLKKGNGMEDLSSRQSVENMQTISPFTLHVFKISVALRPQTNRKA